MALDYVSFFFADWEFMSHLTLQIDTYDTLHTGSVWSISTALSNKNISRDLPWP